ncbi:MAG: sigma-54-dependent Fis family transcriptional regulator, partial [Methanobacteriota archaeon]
MKVAIIENQFESGQAICKILKRRNIEPLLLTGNEDEEFLMQQILSADVAILDIQLDMGSGLDILARLRSRRAGFPVILITAYTTPENIIQASKLGVRDILEKPFNKEEILQVVEKYRQRLLQSPPHEPQTSPGKESFIGTFKTMGDIYRQIGIAASNDLNVMLVGETGVGKEMAARNIHAFSNRKEKNFVAINCAAVPAELFESELFGHEVGAFTGAKNRKIGLVEQADQGVLFLDEIGEMSVELQSKLLRFLETKKFLRVGGREYLHSDVKIICASNIDIESYIQTGKFRRDLYYRLSQIVIHIPPLRERKSDIPSLVQYFIDRANTELKTDIQGIAPEAMQYLLDYEWPGNIRELKNAIFTAALQRFSGTIQVEDLLLDSHAFKLCEDPQECIERCLDEVLDEKGLQISPALYHELEKRIIELVLEKTDHNLS